MYELIGPASYFIYSKELEYLFVALEKLWSFGKNKNIEKALKKTTKTKIGKFRWLFEVLQGMNQTCAMGFLEFLIFYDVEHFTLKGYEEYLCSLSREDFFTIFFNVIPREEIHKALENEQEKQRFFEQHNDLFSSYLAFQQFFDEIETMLPMFFEFVRSQKCEEIDAFLETKSAEIEVEKEHMKAVLQQKEPFAYSEELMGKNCYHRGPYETFYFMPSVFFPYLFCRVFGKDQFLVYDYQRLEGKKSNVPEQLKALADPTRYRILLLLNQEEHLTGVEVAKKMHLATSTVSHHMNLLRDNGLVNEEPVGSTKYYSISKRSISNCVKVLQDTFLQ